MLYASLILNLALVAAVGYLWLLSRDRKSDAERTAREFELMLQVQQAEQRSELLRLHALLIQARHQPREPSRDQDTARGIPSS